MQSSFRNLTQNRLLLVTTHPNLTVQNRILEKEASATRTLLLKNNLLERRPKTDDHSDKSKRKCLVDIGLSESDDLSAETDEVFRKLSQQVQEPHLQLNIMKLNPCTGPLELSDNEQQTVIFKRNLLKKVAASMIDSSAFPHPQSTDAEEFTALLGHLIEVDPVFVFKVALYARNDLHIRNSANYLLAYACTETSCCSYLSHYYEKIVSLPSDWLKVLELYQKFTGNRSIPAALRRAMVKKFADFDTYQLQKYNKTNRGQKKHAVNTDHLQKRITFKSIVRTLHISQPVMHVMCILGKRYPNTVDEFRQSRLPGTFDSAQANKRMKLPVADTWETHLSAKGNQAATWEWLLENHKVPYMALLRNLRNIILANISDRHQKIVTTYLTNKKAVINSKQFPIRFLRAKQSLEELRLKLSRSPYGQWRKRGPYKHLTKEEHVQLFWHRKRRKLYALRRNAARTDLIIDSYVQAIHTAIRISVQHNVPPIGGSTLLCCNVDKSMFTQTCRGAGEISKDAKVGEMALMMSMMCYTACENCDISIICKDDNYSDISEDLTQRVDTLQKMFGLSFNQDSDEPICTSDQLAYLFEERLISKSWLDYVIVVTNDTEPSDTLNELLSNYRKTVNPKLMYVHLDVSSAKTRLVNQDSENDLYLCGTNEQVLSFIAQHGDTSQLHYVEKIDQNYNIPVKRRQEVQPVSFVHHISNHLKIPKWRTVRVFVSSTFRDMHGERDLLVRYVFPRLSEMACKMYIVLNEVDLRWGITEQEAQSEGLVHICLREVQSCHLFIGILGERYGYVPSRYPEDESLPWLRNHPLGSSVTELEIYSAALKNPDDMRNKAFFFFRDSKLLEHLPRDAHPDFVAENSYSEKRMTALKTNIRQNNYEVYENYECQYGGNIRNKHFTVGLDDFGTRVFNNVWNALLNCYPVEETVIDELVHQAMLQHLFAERQAKECISRPAISNKIRALIDNPKVQIVLLSGKHGSGMTCMMSSLYVDYVNSTFPVIPFFATPGFCSPVFLAKYLCSQLSLKTGLLDSYPEEYSGLILQFPSILHNIVELTGKVLLILDGLEDLCSADKGAFLNWLLPREHYSGLTIVISSASNDGLAKSLQYRDNVQRVHLNPFDMSERKQCLNVLLQRVGKKLDMNVFNNQLLQVISKQEAGSPIYLKYVTEELRKYGDFEMLNKKLELLGTTTSSLLQGVLHRLEQEFGYLVMEAIFCGLIIIRNGISVKNLQSLVSLVLKIESEKHLSLQKVCSVLKNRSVPSMPLAKLLNIVWALRSFLEIASCDRNDECAVKLIQQDMVKVAKQKYMKTAQQTTRYHCIFAGMYHSHVTKGLNKRTKGSPTAVLPHVLETLPWHLSQAGEYAALENLLCDLRFIEAKCSSGFANQLLDDFQIKSCPWSVGKENFLASLRVQQYEMYIARNVHLFQKRPVLIYQQAILEPDHTHVYRDALALTANIGWDVQQLYWQSKPEHGRMCTLTVDDFPAAVTALAASDDGCVAVGMESGLIQLVNLTNGSKSCTLSGHASSITGLCFLKSHMVSAAKDGLISIWDLSMTYRVKSHQAHLRKVSCIVASADGMTFMTAGWDCQLKIWSTTDFRLLSTLAHDRPLNCASYHPVRPVIATGGWDGCIRLWDLLAVKMTSKFYGHATAIKFVRFSSDGNYILAASLDGSMKLWTAYSGILAACILGEQDDCITSLTVSSNGSYIFAGDDHGSIKVWSTSVGKCTVKWKPTQSDEEIIFSHMCLAKNSPTIFTGSTNGWVHKLTYEDCSKDFLQWKINTGSTNIVGLSLMNDENTLVLAGDYFVNLICPKTGNVIDILAEISCSAISSMCCTDSLITTGHQDGTIEIFNVQLMKNIKTLTLHTGTVSCIAFDNTAAYLASVGHDKLVILWHIERDTVSYFTSDAHLSPISTFCWVEWSNYNFVITGADDGTVKKWDDPKNGSNTTGTVLLSHDSAVHSLLCQENVICSSFVDGTVIICNLNGEIIQTRHTTPGSCYAFAINERTVLAIGHSDIQIINIFQANFMGVLSGHTQAVTGLASLHDGHIVSSGNDRSVRMWQYTSLDHTQYKGHLKSIISLDISWNYQCIVSASDDGEVRVWNPDNNKLICVSQHKVSHLSPDFRCALFVNKKGHIGLLFSKRICIVAPKHLSQVLHSFDISAKVNRAFYNPKLTDMLFVSLWNEPVHIHGLCDGLLQFIQTRYENHVTHLGCDMMDSTIWYTLSIDGFLTFNLFEKGENTCISEVQLPFDQNEWPTQALLNQQTVFVGTRNGRILISSGINKNLNNTGSEESLKKELVWREQKVHNAAVTCICIDPIHKNTLYTASMDGSLKVWHIKEDIMLQVGEIFDIMGPIVEMKTMIKDKKVWLVCGCKDGSIHLLERK